MKCSICGGQLSYENGIYVCLNCGTRQTLATIFENTEVFICYTEVDENGRRTKDSVIAQDIYRKLEAAKIHTFYQRISASNLTGDDCEKICTYAMDKAKILILVGSSPKYFEQLLETFRGKFVNKKIIPVYTGIDISILPTELINLQAMNYDNIGAVSNLITSILSTLGRESEINITKITNEKIKKKKKRIGLSIVIVLIIFVAIGSYILFGTPYILKSKKYAYAEELTNEGNYIEAVMQYSSLHDYKNSQSLLKSIYAKYNGYYKSDRDNISLEFKITDNKIAEMECEYDNTSFKVTSEIHLSTIEFQYVDANNKHGNGVLDLTNEGIQVKIINSENNEQNALLTFDDKTDNKVKTITKETLLSWLSVETTPDSLKSQGYKVSFEEEIHAKLGRIYSIQDSSVRFFATTLWSANNTESIIAISAPASILSPEAIGKGTASFLESDVLFVPNGNFPTNSMFIFSADENNTNTTIDKNTAITIVKKCSAIDSFAWNQMMLNVR